LCGIAGFVGMTDKKLLSRMCNVIEHRGPDDSGVFVDYNVCLGNRRLSIIDIAGGHQPIHNEDESVWVIFNGEIYNFLNLKEQLESEGHRFYTQSDTEVIVHLYEEFGDSFVKKLRGMFAIAIFDKKNRKLILARDRVGKKPLYYALHNNVLLFASEIKSMLQYEEIERKINYEALKYFLTFRYVPGPITMFEGIKKLQPGHILIFKNGKIEISKYWDISFTQILDEPEEHIIKKLTELIKESVRIRLISEVPLGAYLSGGTDSSTIVSMMSSFMDEPVKTFSVGFGDERFDELKYSKIVAEEFGTDHHEFIVDPSNVEVLPKIAWHFDEPIADPAAIPTYLLSELAKKYVTVVLTGEGGDEIFAGYEHYKMILNVEKYSKVVPNFFVKRVIPTAIRIAPRKFLDIFFRYSSALGDKAIERANRFLSSSNLEDAYLSIVSIFDEQEKEQILSKEGGRQIKVDISNFIREYFEKIKNANTLNKLLLFEFKVPLPDNLLMKVDKMTMASSIEARSPLLDSELVDFTSKVPASMKIRGSTEKYILRKVMEKFLPKSIVKRKKQRFFVPLDIWFEGELGEVSKQMLSNSKFFSQEYIQRMFSNYEKSKLYYSRQLWNLLTFELWSKIFIEPDKVESHMPKLDKII